MSYSVARPVPDIENLAVIIEKTFVTTLRYNFRYAKKKGQTTRITHNLSLITPLSGDCHHTRHFACAIADRVKISTI